MIDNEDTTDDLDLENVEELEVEVEVAVEATGKPAKVNYITNKEFLAEIHKSKNSYCHYTEAKYSDYDAIIRSLDEITDELVEATKTEKARRMVQQEKARLREAGAKASEIREVDIKPEDIPTENLVFRVMTPKHLPLDPDRKRRGKGEEGNHVKTPFLPFKHYILIGDTPQEVGRSHWVGTLTDGKFSMEHGRISPRLAKMFMLLVDRYARRPNWRGYTYLDEMKGYALMQLSQVGLQFDESKSDNPFAFYTSCVKNAMTRVLNLEKKNQNIRDDILVMNGMTPSFSRQYENESVTASKNTSEVTNIPSDEY